MLAYQLLLASEEYELAEKCKDSIFTLAWTEEHTGSDLLSVRTCARPLPDAQHGKRPSPSIGAKFRRYIEGNISRGP